MGRVFLSLILVLLLGVESFGQQGAKTNLPNVPGGPWVDVKAYGAKGDGVTDDTKAIQAAIDSVTGGTIYFPPGSYANTGITVKSSITLKGGSVGASTLKFTPSTGSCVTLPPECASFRVEDMYLVSPARTSGCGIDGTNEYVRYFSMHNFHVTGFKRGIYIQQGMHITLDYGYVCGPGKNVPGSVCIQFGDEELKKGCTTATIRDVYITNAETNVYNRAAPLVMIRPIMETCQYGLKNYARSTLISPFFSGCEKYDAYMYTNGCLILGGYRPQKIGFADGVMENRTSYIPDTADAQIKIGRMRLEPTGFFSEFLDRNWSYGTAPPAKDTWAQGDIRWNTAPSAKGTPGWVCVKSGSPGTWTPMAKLGTP